MKAIFEPVYNTAGVEQLNKELAKDGGRTVMVSGCIDTQKLHFSSAIASNYNFQLVITSDEGKARDMAEDARFFNGGNVMYYPAKDVIFYNADVQGRQIAGERIRCIAAIIDRLNKSDIVKSGTEKSTEKASDGPLTIVTTIDGISDMLLPVDRFKRAVINLKKGDILDVEDMAKKLTAMGFERFGMVEAKGTLLQEILYNFYSSQSNAGCLHQTPLLSLSHHPTIQFSQVLRLYMKIYQLFRLLWQTVLWLQPFRISRIP